MAKSYAAGTKASIAKSEDDIKSMLRKAGAETIMIGEDPASAYVAFHLSGRSIRFKLPLPRRDEDRFTMRRLNQSNQLGPQTPDAAANLWVQACRERWRQLTLCIKAKLVSVQEGVETFDDAFLSQIVTPDGTTVGDKVKPQMAALMDGKPLRPLIEGPR